jgi:hypothetical protein
MRTRMALTGAVLAGALTVGAVLPALAEGDEDTTTGSEETTERGAWRGPDHGANHEAFAAALAEELDLPEEDVTAAIDTVRDQLRTEMRAPRLEQLRERLADAVEAGELTQQRADEILEAHESGEFQPGEGMRLRGDGEGRPGRGDGDGRFGRGPGGPGMHGRAMLDG